MSASERRASALDIKMTPSGLKVQGLTSVPVVDTRQVLGLLKAGTAQRAVGSHDMNERSSRSHSLLTLTVTGVPKAGSLMHARKQRSVARGDGKAGGGGGGGESRSSSHSVTAKLNLIDLAGSERVSKTDAKGQRLKEAQAINKSLSAFGDVISALGGKKGSHVPYRNSKLTYLLQDSLSGNSKVLMFCNVSPAAYNVGETLCTLQFAERCRNTALKKEDGSGGGTIEIRRLKDKMRGVKQRMTRLKAEIEDEGGAGEDDFF